MLDQNFTEKVEKYRKKLNGVDLGSAEVRGAIDFVHSFYGGREIPEGEVMIDPICEGVIDVIVFNASVAIEGLQQMTAKRIGMC